MAGKRERCPHIWEHLGEQRPGQGGKQPSDPPNHARDMKHIPKSSRCFKKLQPSSFPAQANVDSCCRPYLDASSESRGGAKTYGAFCKLGTEQILPPSSSDGRRESFGGEGDVAAGAAPSLAARLHQGALG